MYPLSFEDVSDINEINTLAFSQLRVVIITRQDNIVDGNYTVDVKLFRQDGEGQKGKRVSGNIEIYYQKRQNLTYWLLEKEISSKEEYQKSAGKSVKLIIDQLRAFGVANAEPVPVLFDLLDIEGVKTTICNLK